ncbi:MAG: HAMP domain-containing protein [Gemmatimonadaceae bacterium]|nr:HAMP domain-containing protein [Gemmatimonadaceae bacterium]
MKLAHRLLAGAVLVVTVLIVLLVLLSGVRLRRQLEELEVAHLTREARLIAREWTTSVDPDALATGAGAAIGHRVTLIDHSGRVIGDSEFRGEARTRLENHSTRPEVIAALRDSVGTSNRTSPSAGDNELYVAVRSQFGITRVSISTASLDAIVGRGQRDVLISGFVALVAALILAAAFSRAVSNPVVELRDVAQALAAGDLSRRPALSAPGEVGDLAAAVHRMAEQLTSRLKALEDDDMHMNAVIESLQEGVIAVDARRQIVQVNESGRRMLRLADTVPFPADRLPRDRTLREALAAALAGESTEPTEITVDGQSMMLTARALGDGGVVLAVFDLTASRRVDAVRRDFVANVSHELKTPLTVIIGFAETLAAGDVPPEQGIRFVEAIQSNAQRMQQIVDDLLDLSRIESGGWVPNPVTVELRAVASEVAAGRMRSSSEKGVRLTVEIGDDAECAFADPTAIRQVFANLADNAIRHTNSGGAIVLYSERAERGTSIGVRDTGVGIAPEHLSRIFERFYRADSGRARDAGGTGLGLAIVRHLVEAHRGRVKVESVVGDGTVVSAFFPDAA